MPIVLSSASQCSIKVKWSSESTEPSYVLERLYLRKIERIVDDYRTNCWVICAGICYVMAYCFLHLRFKI